jgi:hypothetical protein
MDLRENHRDLSESENLVDISSEPFIDASHRSNTYHSHTK